jgi:hypothetical protein
MDPEARQRGEQLLELEEADHRVAADDGQMQGLVASDETENAVDELAALEVTDLT